MANGAEQVRFIHAADLHLGAPFKGLHTSSGEWGRRLVESIPQAYKRVIDTAIGRQVDFVVIAGDLFDQAKPSYADYSLFMEGLERLNQAGIPVYFCTGNHDPYSLWQHDYGHLPPNAHLFAAGDDAGFFLFERDGRPLVLLAGRGYDHPVWPNGVDIAEGITRAAAEERLGPAPFAVGVLHTGLDIDLKKAPTDPAKLLQAGMDYWALGHVHKPYVDNEVNPRIAFSGCIQGRAAKNVGPRGVNLVTLAQGQPNHVEFIPTASVVWERVNLDVAPCETLADIVQVALAELFRLNGEAACDEMIERITLQGATPLHATLQRPGVLEDLRMQINDSYGNFHCDALFDETRAPLDRDKLTAEGLFPATFLETSLQKGANRPDELAYLQQEFIDRGIGISSISEHALAHLEERAESLVLDLLLAERDAR